MNNWFEMSDGTLVNIDNIDYVTPLTKNPLNAEISFTVVFEGGTKLHRAFVIKKEGDDGTEGKAKADFSIFHKLVFTK